jgi:hypothetical protein
MGTAQETLQTTRSVPLIRLGWEGPVIRIISSTAGCAALGGAIGGFFGPIGSGVGLASGGVVGLFASVADKDNKLTSEE